MRFRFSCLAFFLLAFAAFVTARAADSSWPQWRGPLANGSAPEADPPLTWSATNNIKWKVKVPGSGTSTPIVWENKVFLLSAEPTGRKAEGAESAREFYRFLVLCYERSSGKLLWQQTACEVVPHEGHHSDHGYASASPVTDGQHLIVYFGSRGLHCFDLEGKKLWSKDLGIMKTRNAFGEGASPALHGNTIVVCQDDEGDNDFIATFDKLSGKELWRKPRNEPTGWATPLIVESNGKPQVIMNATGRVRAYDIQTGDQVWECGGQTANAIPTPVASKDTVYVTSGFRGSALLAIALGKIGDLTDSDAIRWKVAQHTPYVPSPLLAGDFIYLGSQNNPVISCIDTLTGKPLFQGERLEGLSGIYASPVCAGDRVYVLGRNGTCAVLKKGSAFEVLARNSLGEKTDASPALAGKQVFIRGHENLYCIERR